jgi:hypothetical protein
MLITRPGLGYAIAFSDGPSLCNIDPSYNPEPNSEQVGVSLWWWKRGRGVWMFLKDDNPA